jgi:predicted metal-binding protein
MTHHTLFVCVLCRYSEFNQNQSELSLGQLLFDQLSTELATCEWREAIRLKPVRCMGACSRACVVAFAAPDKLTFILSELSPTQSIPELLKFSSQYIACSGGKVPYKERPEAVKRGIHAVLPSLPH